MATAVGLTLAVFPLLISAAEHYAEAAVAFRRYRRFATEAATFGSMLRIQRAIFQAANKSLLERVVGRERAADMLDNPQHASWEDKAAEDSFMQQLGDLGEAVVDSIRLIRHELGVLGKESEKFEALTAERQEGERINGRQWCRRVGRKIEFAFSESHLQERITRIRDLTEDFRTLVGQAAALSQARLPDSKFQGSSSKEIEKFALVKTAARNLYEALGTACTKHTEHQAHFSLQPVWQGLDPHIRFSIAFRHLTINHSSSNRPMWFQVESVVTGSIKKTLPDATQHEVAALQSLKRCREPSPTTAMKTPERRKKKSVRFRSESPPTPVIVQSTSTLQNLCVHNNFCNQLQNFLTQPDLNLGPNCCIGFLEHSSESKHLVYLDSRAQSVSCGSSGNTTSLMELFSVLQSQRLASEAAFSPFDRVRLAKQLAIAVLQFHATPWLKGSWRSSDVYLYGIDADGFEQISDTSKPYLNVSVKGPHGPISRSSTVPSRTLVRNSLLFGLGVMLLELAHEAPLRSLQKEGDVDANDQNTEYYTADRVRLSASKTLGSRYAEAARKCIQCDFGRGSNLNDTALQERFYRDVVCELEESERKLRELHLDT